MSESKNTRKKKIAPKFSDLDDEKRKRALLKQQHCDAVALHIVGKLIEGAVAEDVFLQTLKYLNQSYFQDIVEERAITNLCGYPVCFNQIQQLPNQTYHISTKSNKVYDVTDRKHFCSNFCYTASNYIKNQILTSPLWFRDQEEIPEFKLFQKSDRLTPGEEIDQGIIKIQKTNLEKNPEFLSTTQFTQNVINEIPDDLNNAHSDSSSENDEEAESYNIPNLQNPKKSEAQKTFQNDLPSTSQNKDIKHFQKVEYEKFEFRNDNLGSTGHKENSEIVKNFENLSLNDSEAPELPLTNENFFYSKLFSPNLVDILNENQKYFQNLDTKLNENGKNLENPTLKGILFKNKGKSIKKSVKFHNDTKNEETKIQQRIFKKPNPLKKINNFSKFDENSLLNKPVIEHKTIFSNFESSENQNLESKVVKNDSLDFQQNISHELSLEKVSEDQNLDPQKSNSSVEILSSQNLVSEVVKIDILDQNLTISHDFDCDSSSENQKGDIKMSSQSIQNSSNQYLESKVVQNDTLNQTEDNCNPKNTPQSQNFKSYDPKIDKLKKFEGHYRKDYFLDEEAFWEGPKTDSGDTKISSEKSQNPKEEKINPNILTTENRGDTKSGMERKINSSDSKNQIGSKKSQDNPNPNISDGENSKSKANTSKSECSIDSKAQNSNLEHQKNVLKTQKIKKVENLLSEVKIPKKTETQTTKIDNKGGLKCLKTQNFDPFQEIQKIGVQKDLIKNTSYSQAKILAQKFHGQPKNDRDLDNIIKKISEKNNKEALVKGQLNNKTSTNSIKPSVKAEEEFLNEVGKIQDLRSKVSDNFLENFETCLYQWFTIDTMVFCYGEEKVRNVLSDKKFKQYLNDKKNLEEKLTRTKKYEEICKKLNLMELTDKYYDESVKEKSSNKKPVPHYEDLKSEAEKLDLRVQAFYSGYFGVIETESEYSSCDEKEEEDDNPDLEKGAPAVLPLVENKDYLPLRKKIFLSSLNRTVTKMCEILDQSPNVVQIGLKELVNTFEFDSKNIVFKSAEWPIVTIFLLKLLAFKNEEYSKILKTNNAQKYIEETTKPIFKNNFEKFFLKIVNMENYFKMFLETK